MSNLRKTAAIVKRTTYSGAATNLLQNASVDIAALDVGVRDDGASQEIKKSTNALQQPRQGQQHQQLSHRQNESRVNATTQSVVRPYEDVPGPRGLPLIGNSWRFAPIIGQYKISDLDKVMKELHINYGKIAKVGGLIGHPDLLFVYDGDTIRNIFKKEETMPHR